MSIVPFRPHPRQPTHRGGIAGLGLFRTLPRSEQHRRVRILAKALSAEQIATITRLQRDEVASIVEMQS